VIRTILGPSLWRVCDEAECSIYLLFKPLPKMFAALGIPTERLDVFLRRLGVESEIILFHGVAQRLFSLP
jgi:hypothetical protein